jgi:tetrahydromethanopterin S-methyltransferase subunit G
MEKLIKEVMVTPAEVAEVLTRNDDSDARVETVSAVCVFGITWCAVNKQCVHVILQA